jgi:ABC-type lipoprotein export system ATPase subunit
MKIQKFSFSHHRENWHIDEVSFDDFNLLVGPSGVGKTRILVALETIFSVAQGTRELDDFEWTINFFHLGKTYSWQLKSSLVREKGVWKKESPQFEINEEKLVEIIHESEQIEIFYLSSYNSKLGNQKLPKLRRTESMIILLSEEDSIAPVQQAFKQFILNEVPKNEWVKSVFIPNSDDSESDEFIPNISEFKNEFLGTPLAIKMFFIQNFYSDFFNEIEENYKNIFPDVNQIRINPEKDSNNEIWLPFEIQDANSEEWISQDRMSSGMFRTLMYIVEIMTTPEGSIILIDEFENSLGINCMSEVTDIILDHAAGLQFIITSHHPYIINNIPWQDWQIVSRKGNRIKTKKATEISALNTASSLDKFTQLINVLDFEEMEA